MSHIRFTASYSSGLVQVSSSVTFDYNVENKVSSSVTFDYNVENKVSSSVTFDYNVEQKVSSSVTFDYNVENKVSSSVTFDYNVENKVSNAVVFDYNVEEKVSSAVVFDYNVENKVSSAVVFDYNVENKVSSAVVFDYNVENKVSSAVVFDYNVENKVSSAVVFDYNNIRLDPNLDNWSKYNVTVADQGGGEYLITNSDNLSQHRLSWDSLVTLDGNSETDYTFSIEAKLNSSKYVGLTAYEAGPPGNNYDSVLVDLSTGETAFPAVGTGILGVEILADGWFKLTLTFSVVEDTSDPNHASGIWVHTSAVNPASSYDPDGSSHSAFFRNPILDSGHVDTYGVISTVTFDYNVENKVSNAVVFDYNVENKVSSAVVFDYNVENKVSSAVVFDYNVENKVSNAVVFDYNVENKVSNAVVFDYNVEEKVSSAVVFDYNVENKVSNAVVFDYNVEEKVSSSVVFDYNVEEKVSSSVVFDYNVENKVSNAVVFDYNVENKVSNAVVFEYNVQEYKDISATDTLTFTTPTVSITADLGETESLSFTTPDVDADLLASLSDTLVFAGDNTNIVALIESEFEYQWSMDGGNAILAGQTIPEQLQFTTDNVTLEATFGGDGRLVFGRGPEKILNGDFNSSSNWTLVNTTIANGIATVNVPSGGDYSALSQPSISYVAGKTYRLQAFVTGESGTGLRFQDNGSDIGGLTTGTGGIVNFTGSRQSVDITWTANSNSDNLIIARQVGTPPYSFTVDSVSVKEVISENIVALVKPISNTLTFTTPTVSITADIGDTETLTFSPTTTITADGSASDTITVTPSNSITADLTDTDETITFTDTATIGYIEDISATDSLSFTVPQSGIVGGLGETTTATFTTDNATIEAVISATDSATFSSDNVSGTLVVEAPDDTLTFTTPTVSITADGSASDTATFTPSNNITVDGAASDTATFTTDNVTIEAVISATDSVTFSSDNVSGTLVGEAPDDTLTFTPSNNITVDGSASDTVVFTPSNNITVDGSASDNLTFTTPTVSITADIGDTETLVFSGEDSDVIALIESEFEYQWSMDGGDAILAGQTIPQQLEFTTDNVTLEAVISATDSLLFNKGPDIVTNGTFDTNSGWTVGSGWSISGGVAVGTDSSGYLTQDLSLEDGKTYSFTYTIKTISSGNVRLRIHNTAFGPIRTTAGTYTEIITIPAGSTGLVSFFSNASFNGTIDDFSSREVITSNAVLVVEAQEDTLTFTTPTSSITADVGDTETLTFSPTTTITVDGSASDTIAFAPITTITADVSSEEEAQWTVSSTGNLLDANAVINNIVFSTDNVSITAEIEATDTLIFGTIASIVSLISATDSIVFSTDNVSVTAEIQSEEEAQWTVSSTGILLDTNALVNNIVFTTDNVNVIADISATDTVAFADNVSGSIDAAPIPANVVFGTDNVTISAYLSESESLQFTTSADSNILGSASDSVDFVSDNVGIVADIESEAGAQWTVTSTAVLAGETVPEQITFTAEDVNVIAGISATDSLQFTAVSAGVEVQAQAVDSLEFTSENADTVAVLEPIDNTLDFNMSSDISTSVTASGELLVVCTGTIVGDGALLTEDEVQFATQRAFGVGYRPTAAIINRCIELVYYNTERQTFKIDIAETILVRRRKDP